MFSHFLAQKLGSPICPAEILRHSISTPRRVAMKNSEVNKWRELSASSQHAFDGHVVGVKRGRRKPMQTR